MAIKKAVKAVAAKEVKAVKSTKPVKSAKAVKPAAKAVKAAPAKTSKVVAKAAPAKSGKVGKTGKAVVKAKAAPARVKKVVEYIPNKEKFTKTSLVQFFMENESAPSKKQVQGFISDLENLITGSIHRKGCGEFMLPGMFKIITRKIPAKERRFGMNPFTKEEQWFAAKPATVRVKIRAMKRIKDAAIA
jgi:hypothetical protein